LNAADIGGTAVEKHNINIKMVVGWERGAWGEPSGQRSSRGGGEWGVGKGLVIWAGLLLCWFVTAAGLLVGHVWRKEQGGADGRQCCCPMGRGHWLAV